MKIETLTGEALAAALDDVARLRIAVFRDWPYLYDGGLDYERNYLAGYTGETAIVVAAIDEGRIVGAATGMGMEAHSDDFAAAFEDRGERLDQIFYCAESVLLPEYRGRGLGHAFFDAREARARELGRRYSAFCAVKRPLRHPLRPEGYRPLNGFWKKRGYQPLPGCIARFMWKDIGQAEETAHTLQFWGKDLTE